MTALLWTIVVVLFALWIIGLAVHWAVSAVWTLFVIAVILLIASAIYGYFTRGGARPITHT